MLKDTIISAFNYDGTLLKWLKKVEDALQNASASEFRVNKKGNATISFSIVFANGDTLESGDIILQQGESVTGATIRQGHLILTLSNGDELDAGDLGAVTGFSINENQHLIVTYQNGTTQDLGAIFNGTINVDTLTSDNTEISTLKPVVENMTGYSFSKQENTNIEKEYLYASVCKNGNKLTFCVFLRLKRTDEITSTLINCGAFRIPAVIGQKLYPSFSNYLEMKQVYLGKNYNSGIVASGLVLKNSEQNLSFNIYLPSTSAMELDTNYYVRFEVTFLLSHNYA